MLPPAVPVLPPRILVLALLAAAPLAGCREPQALPPAPAPRVVRAPEPVPPPPRREAPPPRETAPSADLERREAPAPPPPPDPAPTAPRPATAEPASGVRVLEAIYYDRYRPPSDPRYALDQGRASTAWCRDHGVATLPMIYGWAIDPHQDGRIDEARLRTAIRRLVPAGYDGPACLDYEAPYWADLAAANLVSPGRLRQILAVYLDLLAIARSERPAAQWGLWGLPMMRHTSDAWRASGRSLEPLLEASGAVFPSFYDCHPGQDNSGAVRRHLERVLEDVRGRRPVYAFAWCRHCGVPSKRTAFVDYDEFRTDAEAAAAVAWTDPASGTVHRLAGLVLWDAYSIQGPREQWLMLDARHRRYLELLRDAARAAP